MLISVIVCIYNAERVMMKSLLSLARTLPRFAEIIAVDNHSPDEGTRKELLELNNEGIVYRVDPGKNLGCHGGWNYGFDHSRGHFVCKFDDDTEIQTKDWGEKMMLALNSIPKLGFISADIDAKQANKYEMQDHQGEMLEVALNGVVGFSFVMFRRQDVLRWGKMKTGPYRAAGGGRISGERLYGGEEVYFAEAARSEGKFIAHYPAVKVHHLGNEDRHPDYPGWKYAYGYRGWTNKPMEEWLSSGEALIHYRNMVIMEINNAIPNDVLIRDWVRRLGALGVRTDVEVINVVMQVTKNGVVLETCKDALKAISERS